MIKLNLGCGYDYRKEFINVDVRFDVNPDVVASLDILPFSNNYADLIVCQDILEHFSKPELNKVLPEIFRVLKPNGTLEIRCPDAEKIINKYVTKEYDIGKVLDYLFGGQDYPENVHKVGLTKFNLSEILTSHGFKIVRLEDADEWSNMLCVCVK